MQYGKYVQATLLFLSLGGARPTQNDNLVNLLTRFNHFPETDKHQVDKRHFDQPIGRETDDIEVSDGRSGYN